jgi:hypothetical protein
LARRAFRNLADQVTEYLDIYSNTAESLNIYSVLIH